LALKDADLGIAMGSGSPATRAVAKVVLLDDSFAAVPQMLAEGRRVLGQHRTGRQRVPSQDDVLRHRGGGRDHGHPPLVPSTRQAVIRTIPVPPLTPRLPASEVIEDGRGR
jgi:hypothetical protein